MAPQLDGIVFVVDDDASIRRALGRLLCSTGYEFECFPSARAFLERPIFGGPSCVVLDFRMPDLNGLEVQKRLSAAGRTESIIFLTGYGDVPTCARAMKAGAIDFLAKPFRDEQLLEAITASLERSRGLISDQIERNKVWALIDRLTPRERQVLQLVVAGKLNKQIAADLGASEKTIKVHRGRVMHKMEVFSVAELVRLLERRGIEAEHLGGASVKQGIGSGRC
jgi:FixJ family two-component response regulator